MPQRSRLALALPCHPEPSRALRECCVGRSWVYRPRPDTGHFARPNERGFSPSPLRPYISALKNGANALITAIRNDSCRLIRFFVRTPQAPCESRTPFRSRERLDRLGKLRASIQHLRRQRFRQ